MGILISPIAGLHLAHVTDAMSFKFFAQASGSIAFDPVNNRVFARLRQSGLLPGAPSAAVCTMPNVGGQT